MAFSITRILRRFRKTKPHSPRSIFHRLRPESLEAKLLLTRLFAINTIDQLHEISPTDGTIIATRQLPLLDPSGEALGYDGTDLWYATKTALYRLDPDTAGIREQWWLPRNSFRNGLAVTNGLIYMQSSSVFETLDVFDPETGTIVNTLDLGDHNATEEIPGFVLEGMAGLDGMIVFTGTDLTNEEILFLNPSTGVIVDRFAIDLDASPDGLGVIDNEIHVGSGGDIVHVYDLEGAFVRDYELPVFFDNVVGFGADGVGIASANLFHTGLNDVFETDVDELLSITPNTVLANDLIPNYVEGNWEFLSFTQPEHGSVMLDSSGTLVFDPEQTSSASTSFEYIAGQKVLAMNASDSSTSDWYGTSVAIEGGLTVTGAPLEDAGGTNAGAVYLHELNNGQWLEVAKLVPDDASNHSQFGRAVSISQSTIVVGAWLDDAAGTNAGAAYVFERDQNGLWVQTDKLMGSGTTAGDHFGKKVAIDGNTIVVAAEQDDPLGSASGAAYVFQRDSQGDWQETGQLVASDGAAIDRFGGDVAIHGDTIIVGAYRASPSGTVRTGAAYVFGRNEGGAENWGQTQQLLPSDPSSNDQFGITVDVDGDRLVVGAHLAEFDGPPFKSNAGAVYVFERDESDIWSELTKLHADAPGSGDRFGSSVSIEGDVILVGAPLADVNYSDSGAAYLFYRESATEYLQVRKLFDQNGRTRDKMGTSVAVTDAALVIGTPHGDAAINNVGTVQISGLVMSVATVEIEISNATNLVPDSLDQVPAQIMTYLDTFHDRELVSWSRGNDAWTWLERDDASMEPHVLDLAFESILK